MFRDLTAEFHAAAPTAPTVVPGVYQDDFLKLLDTVTEKFNGINNRNQILKQKIKEGFDNPSRIEAFSKAQKVLIDQTHADLLRLQNLNPSARRTHVSAHRTAIVEALSRGLSAHTEAIQDALRRGAAQLRTQMERRAEIAPAPALSLRAGGSFLDGGGVALTMLEPENERVRHVERISHTISDLSAMYTTINTIAEEQREGLLNIEANIDLAHDDIETANGFLGKALARYKKRRKTIIMVQLVLFVVLLIYALVG